MCDYCYWEEALDTVDEIIELAEETIDDDSRIETIIEKATEMADWIDNEEHITDQQRMTLDDLRDELEDLV